MAELASLGRDLDPFPIFRRLRETSPVLYDSNHGSWNIFGYNDVQQVLSDYKAFSSQFAGNAAEGAGDPFAASIIGTDPPRHRQLRNLVTQAFTPRAVDALAPRIAALVKGYLEDVQSAGRMDVIQDLGYPLPVTVIAEMLGVPTDDRDRFKHWSDSVVSTASFGENVDFEQFSANQALLDMSMYFMEMIQQRREQPGQDLISGLLAANVEGQSLDLMGLLGFCVLLLVAGNETTTNLIGNALLTFASFPGTWERLRAQPELLPVAIEEVLRYRSPVQAMYRIATGEVHLEGGVIPEGAPVVAWIGSANHDEGQFADPEKFDLARNPNRHLAFGHGIHYCLGAPLARLEARVALGIMLERFRCVELVPQPALERLPSMIVYGLRHLPISFELA